VRAINKGLLDFASRNIDRSLVGPVGKKARARESRFPVEHRAPSCRNRFKNEMNHLRYRERSDPSGRDPVRFEEIEKSTILPRRTTLAAAPGPTVEKSSRPAFPAHRRREVLAKKKLFLST